MNARAWRQWGGYAAVTAVLAANASAQVVRIAPIVRQSPTPAVGARVAGVTPPASAGRINTGSNFFVEIWATNVGAPLNGLACVHVDATYNRTDLMDAVPPVQNSPLFGLDAVPVVIDDLAGTVDDAGGCQSLPAINLLGVGEWVLIERIPFLAVGTGGSITVSVADANNVFAGTSIIGQLINVAPASIDFQSRNFVIGNCLTNTDCNDSNPCTDDSCVGFVCVNAANDTNNPDDGLFCNGVDICSGGNVVLGMLPNCDDGTICTTDSCNEALDSCMHSFNTNGCNDGNACTGGDQCTFGLCVGTLIGGCTPCTVPANCNDFNACTTDSCNAGVCANTSTTPPGQCCNPLSGALTAITDNNLCTLDTCNSDGSVTHALTTPPGQCCAPQTGTLRPIDDGNTCTDDLCLVSGTVLHIPNINSCDDGDICTTNDVCTGGVCRGTVTDPLCTPTLDLVVETPPSPAGGPGVCFALNDLITVRLDKGPSTPSITGGQFFLAFDPANLQFISATPGDPPYTFEVFEFVNHAQGKIDYAVGVPTLDPGTTAPATMAVLTFRAIGECDSYIRFRLHTPPTVLTDNTGTPRPPLFGPVPPLDINLSAPLITCPSDITVNAEAGTITATVGWPSVTASDPCDGALPVTCTSAPVTGLDAGSIFPPGTTTVMCETVNSCNVISSCSFDVKVTPFNEVLIDIELSPTIVPGPLLRCITFQVSRCGVLTEVVRQPISFGGVFSFAGMAINQTILVPAGPWQCMTARDSLHTLRSSATDFRDDGRVFKASFIGNPTLGGHWLVGGNLNDDEYIDILDFALYNNLFGPSFADTDCTVPPTHADFNGDGLVNSFDFTFIHQNFLKGHQPDCCGEPGAAGEFSDGPRTEISVRELQAMGLGHLAAADLNDDGMVDLQDMALYAGQPDGEPPAEVTPANAAGDARRDGTDTTKKE